MFVAVGTLLVCVKNLAYYTLLASFYIGKTIFEVFTATVLQSSALCSGILAGIQVLLEDFGLFLRDLADHAGFGLRLVYKSIEYVLGVVTFIYNPLSSTLQWYCNIITAFFTWISNFYTNITTLLTFLLFYTKKLLVLLGSGVWFAITIVPFAIFSLGLLLVYYIGILYNEIITLNSGIWHKGVEGFRNAIEYFWDVPVEALLGLSVITCILYIGVQYSRPIKMFMFRCVSSVQDKLTFNVSLLRIGYNYQKSKKPLLSPTKEKPNEFEYGVCVICHTKPKNMLILPCKHLCTCEDCINQVQRYSGRCPLCRTQMDRCILVYV